MKLRILLVALLLFSTTTELHAQRVKVKPTLRLDASRDTAAKQAPPTEGQWLLEAMGSKTDQQIVIAKIKAAPREYLGVPFIVDGAVTISDYFNYDYDDAEETHYSLSLRPAGSREHIHLYTNRVTGRRTVDAVIAAGGGEKPVKARFKVALNPFRFSRGQWDMWELLDVTSQNADGTWKPWPVLEALKTIEEEKRIAKEELAIAEAEHAAIQRAAAEREREYRTRTWSTSDGKHSIVAEFSGLANNAVTLKKKDGSKVRVPIDKLSDEDREWIEQHKNRKRS